MSEDLSIGRRTVLKRALTVLGGAALAPALIAGCGGDDALVCTDTSGLEAAEIALRGEQNYVDAAPGNDNCINCNFFVSGSTGNCGDCSVLPGPIHPEGYCGLWAAIA